MRNTNKVITKNLRKIRKIRQFTQEQLGRAMGLSAAAIGNYERGDRYIPACLIEDFAHVLDVPVQFLTSKIPEDIDNSDIASSTARELLQELVDKEAWKKGANRKQVQIIQMLHSLLKDEYFDLTVVRDEDENNKNLCKIKDEIWDVFNDLESMGEFSAYFNSYDNNADLIFYTSMFFFSYLIEKQKIVKDESFESKDFLKKAENLIDNESIASNIIAVMYDMKEK